MKSQTRWLIIACCALCFFLGCSREQPPRADDPYRDVPARDREPLRAAVHQFVGLQMSGEWGKMYELLDEPKDEKDRFVRRRADLPVLKEFSPTLAAWIPDGWTVTGCGLFQYPGQPPRPVVASLRARPKEKQWLFTPVGIEVLPGQPGGVKPCSLAAAH